MRMLPKTRLFNPGTRSAAILLLLAGSLGALGAFSACETTAIEGTAIARVGDRDITTGEYEDFVANLPEGLQSTGAGVEGVLENLQSMIDKELLLLEAERLGVPEDREFRRKFTRARDQRISKAFWEREVRAKVTVSEAELRAHFAESGREREIHFEAWAFEDGTEARRAWDRLKGGDGPGADAVDLSEVQGPTPTSIRSDEYFGRDSVHPRLRDVLFSLQKGEISEPIRYAKRHLVVRAVDERPAEFERYRSVVRRELAYEKFSTQKDSLLRELSTRYRPLVDVDGMARFLREGELAYAASAIPADIVLFVHEGGSITSGRFIDQVINHSRRDLQLGDSLQVAQFAADVVIPETLVQAEAHRLGIFDEIAPQMDQELPRRVADELLLKQVKSRVEVSYEEAEAYYQEHPELFATGSFARVQEILVASAEEAEMLRTRLEAGADMAALAKEHTLRAEGVETGGIFHIHRADAARYGELAEAVAAAPDSVLTGPIPVLEFYSGFQGHSLFRVLGRSRRGAGFEDRRVQYVVANIVRKIKQNRRFDEYMSQLRDRYEDVVRVDRDKVRKVAAPSG